jgi:ribosome-binding factor A
MPLGGGAATATVVAALNRAAPFIRRQVARSVKLRVLPAFNFVADSSFDQAQHIDDLLRDPAVARDLHGPGDDRDDSGDGSGDDNGNRGHGA